MAHVITTYAHLLTTMNGQTYTARSCGRHRADGLWEGWLEFVPTDGTRAVRSQRETTQPNLRDLEYWASGLTRVYLEGALDRALTPQRAAATPPANVAPPTEAILDPFAVYSEGEDLFRRRLGALAPYHLRNIVRVYDLAGTDSDLEQLEAPELIELIVAGVRGDRAA
jgi:hypothetical protein